MHAKAMSLDLSSSLTAMDWLPRLRAEQHHLHPGHPVTEGVCHFDPRRFPPRPIGRKLPPSPIDLTARLDPLEAQAYRYHDAKPPYSYATLITYAINSSSRGRMTLNDIYTWICTNFPYYREAGTGWKVKDLLFEVLTNLLLHMFVVILKHIFIAIFYTELYQTQSLIK